MKKLLVLVLIMLLALPALAYASDVFKAGGPREDGLVSNESLSGGAHAIVPATEGYVADIVEAGGWTLYNGLFEGGNMPNDLFGLPPNGDAPMLIEEGIVGIVPCGDSFVYYGTGPDGKQHWLVRRPGEEPRILPISWMVDVFYGDASSIWYAAQAGEGSQHIYRIGLDGTGARRVGTVQGYIFGVLPDGGIVLANDRFDRLTAWKGGKTTTLYAPSSGDTFRFAITTGNDVWVIHGDYYGRAGIDGLLDRREGIVRGTACSSLQAVMLVTDRMDADSCHVMLVDSALGVYADLGEAPYPAWSTHVILQRESVIILNGENTVLSIPQEASAWTAYEK